MLAGKNLKTRQSKKYGEIPRKLQFIEANGLMSQFVEFFFSKYANGA